ncbi:hypothetical protein [Ruminococcus sp.]|uniref:hypothetical protein n=1 Tax=Ruminococcus sp. TaxID=41978 RepID=UPI0025D63C97|nr:hypothetical protein [Ruminococcus sp.]MBQ8966875.1 hypothetical protein [Ruminococcus sp.]
MVVASGIIIVILMAILVPAVTVVIYLVFYRRKINKRLAEGNLGGKPMMSPIAFFTRTFICVTAVAFVIIVNLIFALSPNTKGRNDGFAGTRTLAIKALPDFYLEDSPFEGYTPGADIKGYDKYEMTDGLVTFYYYKIRGNMQGVLPRLMICPVCDTFDEYPMVSFRAKFDGGFNELGASGSSDNGALYAVDCDGYEGDLIFNVYYFTPNQEDMVNAPGQLYDETFQDKAEIFGTFNIDLRYPEPEE